MSNIAQNAGENAVPGTTLAIVSNPAKPHRDDLRRRDRDRPGQDGPDGHADDRLDDQDYNGKVVFIASQAEFTPASIETKDQRTKLVYQVKLDVTDADAALKPGMPADVVLK